MDGTDGVEYEVLRTLVVDRTGRAGTRNSADRAPAASRCAATVTVVGSLASRPRLRRTEPHAARRAPLLGPWPQCLAGTSAMMGFMMETQKSLADEGLTDVTDLSDGAWMQILSATDLSDADLRRLSDDPAKLAPRLEAEMAVKQGKRKPRARTRTAADDQVQGVAQSATSLAPKKRMRSTVSTAAGTKRRSARSSDSKAAGTCTPSEKCWLKMAGDPESNIVKDEIKNEVKDEDGLDEGDGNVWTLTPHMNGGKLHVDWTCSAPQTEIWVNFANVSTEEDVRRHRTMKMWTDRKGGILVGTVVFPISALKNRASRPCEVWAQVPGCNGMLCISDAFSIDEL